MTQTVGSRAQVPTFRFKWAWMIGAVILPSVASAEFADAEKTGLRRIVERGIAVRASAAWRHLDMASWTLDEIPETGV